MNQCAEIFNAHVDWAIANSTYNKNKAHKELYHLLRVQYPSVPSALLQTVRDNALEAIKATKFKSIPKKKPTSGLVVFTCDDAKQCSPVDLEVIR
jgi:hypothetical protein